MPEDEELPTSAALVSRLMEVVGAKSDDELVKRLHDRGVEVQLRSLSRWKSGKGPNWGQALTLLRVAGWLTPEAADSSTGRLEALEARVDQLEAGWDEVTAAQEEGAPSLAEIVRRIVALERRFGQGAGDGTAQEPTAAEPTT